MPQSALIIGAAGTGKTRRLLEIMEKLLRRGDIAPLEIGFVSFTKRARSVGAARAADLFGMNPRTLEVDGWFRTLHSICYRQLGVGKNLLAGSKADNKWLEDWLGEPVKATPESTEEEPIAVPSESSTDADAALFLWSVARNRLVPFHIVWERASRISDDTPDEQACRRIIDAYERAKRIDGRCDFTDILSQFAGVRFTIDGPEEATPQGDVPDIKVWFADEQQDSSALQDRVLKRLTENSKFVYLVGDPGQAIFCFAGSDPRLFQAWPVEKRDVLRQTHRCTAPILELGESVLREASDYWDRELLPAPGEGEVDSMYWPLSWEEEIDPREEWLLLARSNFMARKLAGRLDRAGIPWTPMRGSNRWTAPVRNKAITALWNLQRNGLCTAEEWGTVLNHVPSKRADRELIARGTKKEWDGREGDAAELTNLEGLFRWGATSYFQDLVRSGEWIGLIEHAGDFCSAVASWGWEAVSNPSVRVGTIHSAKGDEADNVALLTTTSALVARGAEDQEGFDTECRIAYVGITRARKRLLLLKEKCLHQMEIPA